MREDFDLRAVFERHHAARFFPLVHSSARDAEAFGQGGLGADDLRGQVDGMGAHGRSIDFLDSACRELLDPDHDQLGSMPGMEISEWVSKARSSKGWTQVQMGDALGLTKGNVSAWEKGRHEPSYRQILKIRELTGVTTLPLGAAMEGETSSPEAKMFAFYFDQLSADRRMKALPALIAVVTQLLPDPSEEGASGDPPLASRRTPAQKTVAESPARPAAATDAKKAATAAERTTR